MALVVRREVLDQSEREIVVDLYQQSKIANGNVDAPSYRADHEDWIEKLNDLENRQLLKRDGDQYRVSFVAMSVLDDPDAKSELQRCEKTFDILRAHYKDTRTRIKEKMIADLGKEIGCTYDQAVRTVRYLLDVSGEWHGGSTTDLGDPETSFIKPSESILRNKTFSDLLTKVKKWHEVDRSNTSEVTGLYPFSSNIRRDGINSKALMKTEHEKSKDIFVVHGHDHGAKEAVARFVEKLGLRPIVLHEKPNAGRTIIEKFSDYSEVAFAIVLLTPDDEGKPTNSEASLRPRARQNVILELGFFLGSLGRAHVCALHVDGVEIPSDYQGVLFVPFDPAGQWKNELVREIKAAGIQIDANRIFAAD
jgi:predicted nucleotide-binding protein